MKFVFKCLNLFLLVTTLKCVSTEKILFVTPMGSKSHKIFFMGVVSGLLDRGHHVTVISAYEPSKVTKNVREVVVTNVTLDAMLSTVFEDGMAPMKNLIGKTPILCAETLAQKQVQDLKKEKFDLVILSMFFSDCYLSFVHYFKVPFIYASPAGLFGGFSDMISNINFPSIVPNILMDAKFPYGFKDRLVSVGLDSMLSAALWHMDSKGEEVCKEMGLCPEDMPRFNEIRKNVSIVIINSVRALEFPPRPVMPNVIYAGGAHIRPAKRLPQDLEDWVKGSGSDGFIFFSLGSALNPSFLPEKYRKILIKVFGSLKQRVLWKWNEESMVDLPPNVKLAKWLPQPDILGHSKLRLFITHGGLLSTLESTYNGVPVIGMPVMADQFSNMKEVESEGWGRVMNWKELEENKFRKLILDTINDLSLREVSQKRSILMKDVPMTPDQTAAFWIEYTMRHKGCVHLMSPVRMMSWYEVYNMDVWLFFGGVLIGLLYLLWRLLHFLLRILGIFKTKQTKRKDD